MQVTPKYVAVVQTYPVSYTWRSVTSDPYFMGAQESSGFPLQFFFYLVSILMPFFQFVYPVAQVRILGIILNPSWPHLAISMAYQFYLYTCLKDIYFSLSALSPLVHYHFSTDNCLGFLISLYASIVVSCTLTVLLTGGRVLCEKHLTYHVTPCLVLKGGISSRIYY